VYRQSRPTEHQAHLSSGQIGCPPLGIERQVDAASVIEVQDTSEAEHDSFFGPIVEDHYFDRVSDPANSSWRAWNVFKRN